MDVGEKILIALKQQKMNQKELAEACHATEASISRYINGERYPKWQIVKRIAEVLNVSLDWLADRHTDGAIEAYQKGWNDAIDSMQYAKFVQAREKQVDEIIKSMKTQTEPKVKESPSLVKDLVNEKTDCPWK